MLNRARPQVFLIAISGGAGGLCSLLSAAPAERRHMRDFLVAIDRLEKPVADIGEGHISTATCLLANLALQLGRPLAYAPAARSISGDTEATNLSRRPCRLPWIHPDPSQV